MKNKILVLGATGNVGSFLMRELMRMDADFLAGVPGRDMPKLSTIGVRGTQVDFDDSASLEAAMAGVDTVFMLLPLSEKMESWGANVIAAALKQRVSFILRSSLIDAVPDSPYFLFRAHGTVDKALRESGLPYAIVHPNLFMQNFVVYYSGIINSTDAFYFPYDTPVSYIDVRDIASADASILASPGRHDGSEYTVTGPEALTNTDIAAILSAASRRPIKFVQEDIKVYEEGLRGSGINGFHLEAYLSLARHAGDGKQSAVTGDIRALTGRIPGTFERFAGDYSRTWVKEMAKAV